MPSVPLAELRRFSMNFLLGSSCCSLRKRKREKEQGRQEDGEVESGGQDEETAHMDDTWMVVSGVRTRLELEPM